MSELTAQTCEPCEGGIPAMDVEEAQEQLDRLTDWGLVDVPKIRKKYTFDSFPDAIKFVNSVAEIAESEGHHPNMSIDYNEVIVTIWTHAIDGLSKNDFILAAKLDEAAREFSPDL